MTDLSPRPWTHRDGWPETSVSYDMADLEQRMEAMSHTATELHDRAYDLYDAGRLDEADALIAQSKAAWARWRNLKLEYAELEASGGW